MSCGVSSLTIIFIVFGITKWIDEGSPVDIIYLYFQKPFKNIFFSLVELEDIR